MYILWLDNKSMSYITIAEAAKILNVNKRTLMRWDEEGIFPAKREEVSKIRIYDKNVIEKTAKWFDLRKREKEHLRKLPEINRKRNKVIPTAPLDPYKDPPGHTLEELRSVYREYHDWKKKYDDLHKEHTEFTEDFYRRLKE